MIFTYDPDEVAKFWNFLPAGSEEKFVRQLTADLESGEWDKRYGKLRSMPEYNGALRLIIAKP